MSDVKDEEDREEERITHPYCVGVTFRRWLRKSPVEQHRDIH